MKKYIGITYVFIFAIFILQFFPTQGGLISVDEIEHLRTSFLIHQGKIPFLDFFQHHGVLLQYLFSPVYFFVYRDPAVFWISRIVIYLILLGCLYYGIKIIDCFKVNPLISRLTFPVFWGILAYENTEIFYFRPDTLMLFFFLMGVYYFFQFSLSYQIKTLSISLSAFILSFLSLQKIGIFYPVIVFMCLYFLIRKKISIKNFCLASLPAGILLLGYILYLYFTNSLYPFVVCCITVNKLLTKSLCHSFQLFEVGKLLTIPIFLYMPYFLIKYRNICSFTLFLFFVIAYTQLCFCDPWAQYRISFFTIMAILITLMISDFKGGFNKIELRYINILTVLLCLFIAIFHAFTVKEKINNYMSRYQKVLNVVKEDYTVADEFRDFNIWNPTTAWHEFFLVQDIDYEQLGLPKKDANENIRQNKPDIIHAGGGPLLPDLQPEYEKIPNNEFDFHWSLWRKK